MSRQVFVLSNLIIVLQVFLLIFCFVELGNLPEAVLFIGHFHPILLHLPVTLILLLVPISMFLYARSDKNEFENLFTLLLYYVTLITTLTAILGVFLATDENYNSDSLFYHKWLGVSIALFCHLMIYIRNWSKENRLTWNVVMSISVVLIIATGHYGGTLTHGKEYLSFNNRVEINNKAVFSTDTTLFAGGIQPILNEKCISCHNSNKSKGGLNMQDLEHILKGGKSGAIWVAGNPDKSQMIERLLLDINDEKHMPPKGKSQLSIDELNLFTEWIKAGADYKVHYASLSEEDTLHKIIATLVSNQPKNEVAKTYNFKPVPPDVIEKLNSPFRRILPISVNSPALSVKFYLKEKFNMNMLNECKEIADNIIELNLSGMPVDDEVFNIISTFSNLEKLNLNATGITGKGINQLANCKKLEQISVTTTSLGITEVKSIERMPSVKNVFIWNTKINESDLASLKKSSPGINWNYGYIPDKNELLKLSAPFPTDKEKTVLEKQEFVTLKTPFPGAKIRYTLDGSDPDSVNGEIYTKPIPAKGLLRVKSIATAEGWISSSISDFTFFQKGLPCDSVVLLSKPSRISPPGAATIIDQKKGLSQTADQLYINWIGFRENPFKAGFYLKKDTDLHEIILSLADMTGSYVFPPTSIVIKAGDSPKNLKIIGQTNPEMPGKHRPNTALPYTVSIKPGKYSYVEIEAKNLQKLPVWHEGKGEKAWVFVDEVFFY
jgi:uncharacterized membrane protein